MYQFAYDRIGELARAKGEQPIPPRLGNLVKAYPEWSQATTHKREEQEEQRKQRGHVPGSGTMRNWTEERRAGRAEPIYYTPKVTSESTKTAKPALVSSCASE